MIPLLLFFLLLISPPLQLLFIEILIHILILISISVRDSISNLSIPLLSEHSLLLILVSLHLLVYSFMIVYLILSNRSMQTLDLVSDLLLSFQLRQQDILLIMLLDHIMLILLCLQFPHLLLILHQFQFFLLFLLLFLLFHLLESVLHLEFPLFFSLQSFFLHLLSLESKGVLSSFYLLFPSSVNLLSFLTEFLYVLLSFFLFLLLLIFILSFHLLTIGHNCSRCITERNPKLLLKFFHFIRVSGILVKHIIKHLQFSVHLLDTNLVSLPQTHIFNDLS